MGTCVYIFAAKYILVTKRNHMLKLLSHYYTYLTFPFRQELFQIH